MNKNLFLCSVALSLLIMSSILAIPVNTPSQPIPITTEIIPAPTVLSQDDYKQIECLAKNIYHEAAFEPRTGWLAVAAVTMNRLQSGLYPNSVCGVVYQKTGKVYQFSWVGIQNKLSRINSDLYTEILNVATSVYTNYDGSSDVTNGAMFYHGDYIKPRWKGLQRTTKIGQHIFYKK